MDTNIKYLVDNGINIWNKDAYNYYLKLCKKDNWSPMAYESWLIHIKDNDFFKQSVKNAGGDLGRVYGAQWRNWNTSSNDFGQKNLTRNGYDYVDQISNLINGLKETPMGTKHIVTAWNPAELDDMALPPCHFQFIILPEPIYENKRLNKASNNGLKLPEYKFTLKFSMRSSDVFLGLPFNLSSYALLAQIIGKMVNMIPKRIIGDLSNVHIYEPHLDAVKDQLSRSVTMFNSECELEEFEGFKMDMYNNIDNWLKSKEIKDFKLTKHSEQSAISAEMLPYNK